MATSAGDHAVDWIERDYRRAGGLSVFPNDFQRETARRAYAQGNSYIQRCHIFQGFHGAVPEGLKDPRQRGWPDRPLEPSALVGLHFYERANPRVHDRGADLYTNLIRAFPGTVVEVFLASPAAQELVSPVWIGDASTAADYMGWTHAVGCALVDPQTPFEDFRAEPEPEPEPAEPAVGQWPPRGWPEA